MDIILFGCGVSGYEALCFLGEENVKCFCDNNPDVVQSKKFGKPVLSFMEMKSWRKSVIILCVKNRKDIYDMARQCEENGIYDYVAYELCKDSFSGGEEFLNYVNDPENRNSMRKKMWFARIKTLEMQVSFLKQHADIRSLKPATGWLRERQLDCVRTSAEFLTLIEPLEIHPFLCGGNLIGYVRHGGFVPWDDDIDFSLIRSEYEQFKEYCRTNLNEKEWCWEDMADHFSVWRCQNGVKGIGMDFFVLDYYAEDYPFEALLDCSRRVREKLMSAVSLKDKIRVFERAVTKNRQYTVPQSSRIYFGVDNTEMDYKYHKGYIPEEVLFPLKKVKWEGEKFWVPNQPEEFALYEFEDIWKFPEDVGIPRHFGTAINE